MLHLLSMVTGRPKVSGPPYSSDEYTEFLYHLDEAALATSLADSGPLNKPLTNWASALLTTGVKGEFDNGVRSMSADQMAYGPWTAYNYLDFLNEGTVDLWWAPPAAPSTILTASSDQQKYFFHVWPTNASAREISFRCGKIGGGNTRLVLKVNQTNLGVDVADVLSYFDYTDLANPIYTHIRGEWKHGQGIRMLLNGTEVASSSYIGTGAASTTCAVYLARFRSYSSPWEIGMVGFYDEFRLSRILRA